MEFFSKKISAFFCRGSENQVLAILHPRKLSVYSISGKTKGLTGAVVLEDIYIYFYCSVSINPFIVKVA